jgi:threonine/homoserine/homoserine lactone efflux protein
MDQGVRAGLVSMLGLVAGGIVHLTAATLGISALLAATPRGLDALTWAGAAYLAWLGWRELAAPRSVEDHGPAPLRRRRELFRQGFLVNLLNPKAVLFFLAFLPQFVRTDGVDPRLQVLALGAVFLALALCTDTFWVLVADRAGRWLRSPRRIRARRRLSAGIYLALAVAAVLA